MCAEVLEGYLFTTKAGKAWSPDKENMMLFLWNEHEPD